VLDSRARVLLVESLSGGNAYGVELVRALAQRCAFRGDGGDTRLGRATASAC
jgi:hypothetical protein